MHVPSSNGLQPNSNMHVPSNTTRNKKLLGAPQTSRGQVAISSMVSSPEPSSSSSLNISSGARPVRSASQNWTQLGGSSGYINYGKFNHSTTSSVRKQEHEKHTGQLPAERFHCFYESLNVSSAFVSKMIAGSPLR